MTEADIFESIRAARLHEELGHPPMTNIDTDTIAVIICAANRWPDGLIIPSARHFDTIMHDLAKRIFGEKAYSNCDQGFIDQFGKFYSRAEAMLVVKENGQPFNAERNVIKGVLYSEGLY